MCLELQNYYNYTINVKFLLHQVSYLQRFIV